MFGLIQPGFCSDAVSWQRRAGRYDFAHKIWFEYPGNTRARPWDLLWPSSSMMSGDRSSGYSQLGQDCSERRMWGPYAPAMRGQGMTKYIVGRCVDGDGIGISGVTIDLFRSSTDELVSTTGCDTDGYYAAPTQFSGENHYIIAREEGGTNRIGGSINTLVPTNIDGT